MSEEELETSEGEGVDLLDQLLELVGWSQVNDKETEKDLSFYYLTKKSKPRREYRIPN